MNRNITIFMASPRKDGNSDKLAEAFISGAKIGGNNINVVAIRNYRINGCIGCEYCYEHNGQCALKDDMQKIYTLLAETDIVVFATPIYYQNFPSQLKAVIDRLYVMENRKFPIRGAVLMATYATAGREMSEQTISYYKCLIKYHGWKNEGILVADNLDEKDDILGNIILKEAQDLGASL